MERPIRLGFVGAGENTRVKHIPGFLSQNGVQLHGVANRRAESTRQVRETHGMPRAYATWQELIADPEIDAVCIGTWPCLHCEVTLAALAAGKHVLCEARMAMNYAEARRMLEASEQAPGLVCQVVPSPFMQGPDAAITQCLAAGDIGDILAVDLRFCGRQFVDTTSPMNWRQDVEASGLNTLAMGILYEAAMRWVGEARTVSAHTKTHVAVRPDAQGIAQKIEVPDHVEVVGELASGASYHLACSAVAGMGPENAAWIFGSEGTLRADFAQQTVGRVRRGESGFTDVTPDRATWQGWRVEEEFIQAIRGREKITRTTFADGLRYMAFTEAVARSQATGTRVNLPLGD